MSDIIVNASKQHDIAYIKTVLGSRDLEWSAARQIRFVLDAKGPEAPVLLKGHGRCVIDVLYCTDFVTRALRIYEDQKKSGSHENRRYEPFHILSVRAIVYD